MVLFKYEKRATEDYCYIFKLQLFYYQENRMNAMKRKTNYNVNVRE